MNINIKTLANKRIVLCVLIAAFLLVTLVLFSACSNNKSKNNDLPTVTGDKFPNEIAENATINEKYKKDAEDMLKYAVDTFLNDIVKIPRVSGHEERMREYIINFAKNNNFEPKDCNGNIYFDVPATEGMENLPKIILQGHMDMVGTNEDENIDMTNVPINAVLDKDTGEIHSYDYETNIGADDAEGITTMMAIASNKNIKHGPIRLLFTYEEETTQAGAQAVTEDVIDADYLINIDCGPVGVIVESSAGAITVNYDKTYNVAESPNMTELDCHMYYLLGGHSGVDIDKDIIIAKNLVKNMFNDLDNHNIEYQLSYSKAGKAVNAIINEWKFNLLVPNEKAAEANKIINDMFQEEKAKHKEEYDSQIKIDTIANSKAKALSFNDTKNALNILNFVTTGPLDKNDRGNVIESCNAGIINLENGKFHIGFSYRSNIDDRFDGKEIEFKNFAQENSIECTIKLTSGTWDSEQKNQLRDLLLDSYTKSCNFNGSVIAVHGGLECAFWKKLNPNIKMACIGADVEAEHGIDETWYTKSLPAHFASILYVLENIK